MGKTTKVKGQGKKMVQGKKKYTQNQKEGTQFRNGASGPSANLPRGGGCTRGHVGRRMDVGGKKKFSQKLVHLLKTKKKRGESPKINWGEGVKNYGDNRRTGKRR